MYYIFALKSNDTKIHIIMDKAIINVRGSINNLEIGQSLTLDLRKHKASYIRNQAAQLKLDYGKVFSTNKRGMNIIVTRTA